MIPPPLQREWRCRRRGRSATNLLSLAEPGLGLDPAGVADLLAWGAPIGARSLLVGVEARRAPWSPSPPPIHPGALSDDERADRLWTLLVEALAAAGPGRVALSGGLDSRAVAAAAVQAGHAVDAGTFGDADAADLPAACAVAQILGLRHDVQVLDLDCALEHEERVWRASSGTGGPASAPGAATDAAWAGVPRLLSGTSGDVIWGDTRLAPPSTRRRLRRLGLDVAPSVPSEVAPAPPRWLSAAGRGVWVNLWTRQAAVTWQGSASRREVTEVVPVPWHEPLLSFCLALSPADRRDRALLRRALARHAPRVADLPLARGRVHDLDRALRSSTRWRSEIDRWMQDGAGLQAVGLRPAEVRRLVRSQRAGRGRSAMLSRLRALGRWGAHCASQPH